MEAAEASEVEAVEAAVEAAEAVVRTAAAHRKLSLAISARAQRLPLRRRPPTRRRQRGAGRTAAALVVVAVVQRRPLPRPRRRRTIRHRPLPPCRRHLPGAVSSCPSSKQVERRRRTRVWLHLAGRRASPPALRLGTRFGSV